MVTHIVLFKLSDPTPENIATADKLLLGMSAEIPFLRHLEVGIDVLRSPRSYDIALVTKFDSLDDLQAYQVHPHHADVVAAHMKSVSSSVAVVDYES